MIWTWRHWVLIYSMSLPLWDLCWSFALVALTDYLKAALAGEEAAGLCWTSWYILPPSQGVSGLLKPLFFFLPLFLPPTHQTPTLPRALPNTMSTWTTGLSSFWTGCRGIYWAKASILLLQASHSCWWGHLGLPQPWQLPPNHHYT